MMDLECHIEKFEPPLMSTPLSGVQKGGSIPSLPSFQCIDTGAEDDDCTPFERMSREMSDITVDKDGGVLKCVLRHGAGAVVPPTALCRVHYNAYIEGMFNQLLYC